MSNKETLQANNEMIEKNNALIARILEIIDTIPGGTGLPAGKYVQNGLIAWWEGEDALDENLHWNSRVGDDYIYQYNPTATADNSFGNIKTENAYVNDKTYGLVTNQDYWNQGYTIEVVGKANSQTNSTNSAGCTLLAFDKQYSPMIQIWGSDNSFQCLNNNLPNTSAYTFANCLEKRYKYAICLDQIPARNQGGSTMVSYAVNDIGWYTTSSTVGSPSNNYPNLTIMCYYRNSYQVDGEINSIRIYNRKLSSLELAHNYKLDKERFGLDEYIM